MKRMLIIGLAFVLGCVLVSTSLAQSVVVQPNPRAVRVDTVVPYQAYRVQSNYVMVQPPPVVVTRAVIPPPPKPLFWTPFRNWWWRAHHRPRVVYGVSPYNPQQVQPQPNQ